MVKNEKGSIVVETMGSFILFILLMISILTLINIVTVQSRVHYALTQTALELSMYSHIIHTLDLTDIFKSITEGGSAGSELIGSIQDDLGAIHGVATGDGSSNVAEVLGNLNTLINAIGGLGDTVGGAIGNPRDTLTHIFQYGLVLAQQEAMIRPLFYRHLAIGETESHDYLRRHNVIDSRISLGDSRFINADGNIILVAEYRINYGFGLGALPLPEAIRTLSVRQTVKTRAWLGGVDNS